MQETIIEPIKLINLDFPFTDRRVLLHTCCAPCSSAIVECLLQNQIKPTIFFFNPNIFPESEYLQRKNEAIQFAKLMNIEFVDADYNHELWKSATFALRDEPERGKRCQQCFDIRLLATAQYATTHNYQLISTTLASSRWKDLEQINAAGHLAESKFPTIKYWNQNWRKGGLQNRRNQLLKEYNFYNQLYCGCEYSLRDANKWRQETGKAIINPLNNI